MQNPPAMSKAVPPLFDRKSDSAQKIYFQITNRMISSKYIIWPAKNRSRRSLRSDRGRREENVPVAAVEFRDLMAGVCAPVTVVTTAEGDTPYGATVSAFASLSLDPPMVTVALDRSSFLLARILQTSRFGVNVLARPQEATARLFATRGADRFGQTPWTLDHDMPRLASAASWLVCELANAIPGGDHMLLLGLVTHAQKSAKPPLVYAERIFGAHSALLERENERERKAKRLTLLGGDMQ
jgi:flavin reductase (DIM6/NTAB) family NADH-FMN oxidoreductase RutF